jgi:hypothetical protein
VVFQRPCSCVSHVNLQKMRPNKAFKPNPLRGSA